MSMPDPGQSFVAGFNAGWSAVERTRLLVEDRRDRNRASAIGRKVAEASKALDGEMQVWHASFEDYQRRAAKGEVIPQQESKSFVIDMMSAFSTIATKKMDLVNEAVLSNAGNRYVGQTLAPIANQAAKQSEIMMNFGMQAERMMMEHEQFDETMKQRQTEHSDNLGERKASREQQGDQFDATMEQRADFHGDEMGQRSADRSQRERFHEDDMGVQKDRLGLEERRVVTAEETSDIAKADKEMRDEKWQAAEPLRKVDILAKRVDAIESAVNAGVSRSTIAAQLGMEPEDVDQLVGDYEGFDNNTKEQLKDVDQRITRAEKEIEEGDGDPERLKRLKTQRRYLQKVGDRLYDDAVQRQNTRLDYGDAMARLRGIAAEAKEFGDSVKFTTDLLSASGRGASAWMTVGKVLGEGASDKPEKKALDEARD